MREGQKVYVVVVKGKRRNGATFEPTTMRIEVLADSVDHAQDLVRQHVAGRWQDVTTTARLSLWSDMSSIAD